MPLGVGTMNSAEAAQTAADIRAVYQAVISLYAGGVNVDLDPSVAQFDVESGDLIGALSFTPPARVSSSAAGSVSQVSRAAQMTVRLTTDGIRNNRLVQGRHFLGPVNTAAYDGGGQVPSATRTTVQSAYDGVLDVLKTRLVVYSQPREDAGAPAWSQVGQMSYVQSVSCNATPGTLRSRKI